MALDLTGIDNSTEFYSAHYLDALLEKDLKDLFSRWKRDADEKGTKLPSERLGALENRWLAARAKAIEERDPAARWELTHDFHLYLLEALGYDAAPGAEPLEDDALCPVLFASNDPGASLWIVDAPFPLGDEDAPLDSPVLGVQYPGALDLDPLEALPRSDDSTRKGEAATWRELLDHRLFRMEGGPRWVLFLGGTEIVLAERNKWPAGKLLRFDLGEILTRREKKTLRAVCGLIHRDALCPASGTSIHDTLEDSSHKHAYAVSGDLKYGVRRAVELLANEAVHYRRETQKKSVFSEPDLAERLKDDCLTYLYRLLFLFYVEARGSDLGIVPMKSDAYRLGYSLESLREYELVPLTTEAARNGFFLDTSLKRLFRIVNEGFGPKGTDHFAFEGGTRESMRVPALRSPLFDDERLTVLRGVRFRNFVLQEVLQLLSLSAERKKGLRGRISYAQLGISQLGAVYESLLSYTGFFADSDDGLYEVAAKSDVKALEKARAGSGKSREDIPVYFVPGSEVDRYDEAELVRDERGQPVRHEKGTFLYTLAGRARQKSASYYTPEVLTQCVVKYSLKELLYDEDGKRKLDAAEILDLAVCEPAMGSGAFLIEAIDQLADAYLEARQEELDETLPSEDYQREKRRVKARLATNNCYGVDLNPVAVRLAQVSLWLGAMAEDQKCPWFGLRLAYGNSLIGARRDVYRVADIRRKGTKAEPNWLGLVPERVPLHASPDGSAPEAIGPDWKLPSRPKGTVYHFLLPDAGMAAFDKDKVLRSIEPEGAALLKAWRREFTKPFEDADVSRLERLSDAVDRLWAEVVRERHLVAAETSDRIPVWGDPALPPDAEPGAYRDPLEVRDQEEVARALESTSSAIRRLRLVMDAWCALWFWPIEKAALLPTREEWLASLELVLLGETHMPDVHTQLEFYEKPAPRVVRPLPAGASSTVGEPSVEGSGATAVLEAGGEPSDHSPADRMIRLRQVSAALAAQRRASGKTCGVADVADVVGASPWLAEVETIRTAQAFHHWELRFAEVFAARGGFDLILGNPPWIKLQWQEGDLLSEFDPSLVLRKDSASKIARQRPRMLERASIRTAYSSEFTELEGGQIFLNALQNEPLLRGMQTNLYKCFLTRAWRNAGPKGVSGFLHPEGVFDDPKGGPLRRVIYSRLAGHYQFVNELKLFAEIANLVKYSVNVYGPSGRVRGVICSNLFHPSTIDRCFAHDGGGPVPGIKCDGEWELRGHLNRLIRIDEDSLALFAALYDAPGTDPLEARLPVVHSTEILDVLRRFADQPRKLGDLRDEYFATEMWHETNRQKDGTIRPETRTPEDVSEWILQGPHFFVGNPFYKTSNEGCSHNKDYTSIDLTAIPDDYLPRTNFVPACSPAEYARRTPKWKGRPVSSFYRVCNRKMISPTGERTLIASVMPPGASHVDGALSVAMRYGLEAIVLAGIASSICLDFYVKSSGKANLRKDIISSYPWPKWSKVTLPIARRAMILNCLTKHYAKIWVCLSWYAGMGSGVVLRDPRCPGGGLEREWNRNAPLRADLARRTALVELDVLVAMLLRVALKELLALYRVQFPVLQQYERRRVYDQHGRIVPASTTAAGNPAVNLVALASQLREQAGFDIHEPYAPGTSESENLLARKVKLSKRDAGVLGVPERCTMRDLMKPTTVRYWDDVDGQAAPEEGRPVELLGLAYTDPGLEPRMERVYPTPWTRCDREEDYRVAWAEFERRLGGGTRS